MWRSAGTFKDRGTTSGLTGGVQDPGEPVVTELLLDWLDPFLTVEEQDRLVGWHLGVSL